MRASLASAAQAGPASRACGPASARQVAAAGDGGPRAPGGPRVGRAAATTAAVRAGRPRARAQPAGIASAGSWGASFGPGRAPPVAVAAAAAAAKATSNGGASTCAAKPKVLLVGATTGLGLEVARALAAAGSTSSLHACARPGSDSAALEAVPGLQLAGRGDAKDAAFVASLLTSLRPEVVVVCVGGKASLAPIIGGRPEAGTVPDFPGFWSLRNVVDAAVAAGTRRVVLVSQVGAGDSWDAIPCMAKDVLRPLLMDKERAEQYLRESALPEIVIVRPGPLTDEPASGTGLLAVYPLAYGPIARAELARLLARCVTSTTAAGATLTALDSRSIYCASPSMRELEPWEEMPFEPFLL